MEKEQEVKPMSLWNDVFKIEIVHPTDVYHGEESHFNDSFKGSLKGAIRYFINKYKIQKGHFCGAFYNSKGEYLKEIGW